MPNREPTPSSGNVFADLNLPHADDLLAKAELAAKIIAEIQQRRLTQSQAATILGIDQPKVSTLKQGKLSGFSNRATTATSVEARTRRGDHSQGQGQSKIRRQALRHSCH
jgi:predicted XRE-type DNA-binding protein